MLSKQAKNIKQLKKNKQTITNQSYEGDKGMRRVMSGCQHKMKRNPKIMNAKRKKNERTWLQKQTPPG